MKRSYGLVAFALLLLGCGYYPPNLASVASSPNKSVTMTGVIGPNSVTQETRVRGTLMRRSSWMSFAWNLKKDVVFFSPSLYYLGIGSAAGIVLPSNTVLAGFSGISFLPNSLAYGFSLSQAFSEWVCLEYRFQFAEFHDALSSIGLYLEDEGRLLSFQSVNLSFLWNPLYLDIHADSPDFLKENVSIGFAVGVRIQDKRPEAR
jgi:hypothetical protein